MQVMTALVTVGDLDSDSVCDDDEVVGCQKCLTVTTIVTTNHGDCTFRI